MAQRHPTAVYECLIPAKNPHTTLSSVYHAPLGELGKGRPFPAWPEIENANTQCCLPTLLGATYIVHRSVSIEPEEASARAEEYLARHESVDPKIRDRAKAIVKSVLYMWRQWIEDGAVPAITFGPCSVLANLFREMGRSVPETLELYIQAFIFGHLDNFIDEYEAFGYAHEYAHRCATLRHSGRVLEELGACAHNSIHILLGKEKLSHGEITQLWEEFAQTNEQIVSLVRRFRPLEEIFANYFGMRCSPSEVRNAVKSSLKKELNEKNWYAAYKAFADWCDSSPVPLLSAFNILDLGGRILENIDVDGADLLEIMWECHKLFLPYAEIVVREYDINIENYFEKIPLVEGFFDTAPPDEFYEKLERLVEQRGIPFEVFFSAYESAVKASHDIHHAEYRHVREAIINGEEHQFCPRPMISLRGRPSQNLVYHFITYADSSYEHEWSGFVNTSIFLESLRQQITKGCGLICAHAIRGDGCCSAKEDLLRLYERLPEAYRKPLNSPNCDLIR